MFRILFGWALACGVLDAVVGRPRLPERLAVAYFKREFVDARLQVDEAHEILTNASGYVRAVERRLFWARFVDRWMRGLRVWR